MDEALEKALDFSNFTSTLNAQKRILHEKYLDELVMYSNNGRFTISKELLNFCFMLTSTNINKTVLIDSNRTPIEIDDVEEFMLKATQHYTDVTNTYLQEYKILSTKRNVEGLVDD
tara:strand:- start:769 stop:1116 length:348 start_codon:yes stop_codon:yes gene_type:complete